MITTYKRSSIIAALFFTTIIGSNSFAETSSLSCKDILGAMPAFQTHGVRNGGSSIFDFRGQRDATIPPTSVTKLGGFHKFSKNDQWGGFATIAVGTRERRVRTANSIEHVPGSGLRPASITFFSEFINQSQIPGSTMQVTADSSYDIINAENHGYKLHPELQGEREELSKFDVIELSLSASDGSSFLLTLFGVANAAGDFQLSFYDLVEKDLFGGLDRNEAWPRPVEGWRHSSDYVDYNGRFQTESFEYKEQAGSSNLSREGSARLNEDNLLELIDNNSVRLTSISLSPLGIEKRNVLLVHRIEHTYETDKIDLWASQSERDVNSSDNSVFYRNRKPFVIVRERNKAHIFEISRAGELQLQRTLSFDGRISSMSSTYTSAPGIAIEAESTGMMGDWMNIIQFFIIGGNRDDNYFAYYDPITGRFSENR